MKATVQIGTWNVHTKPQRIDFSHFIKHTLSPSPDFIVLGFQELHSQFLPTIPLEESIWENTNGLMRTGSLKIKSLEIYIDSVIKAIELAHDKGANYRPLYAGRRAALGIIIIVKNTVLLKSIYTGSIGTGLLGLYHNKGAIGASLELSFVKQPEVIVSLCFINSHLGAHEGESFCKWRQDESDHILSSLEMRSGDNTVVLPSSNQAIFLFGDLNYRMKASGKYTFRKCSTFLGETLGWLQLSCLMDSKANRSEIMRLIKDDAIDSLLAQDELLHLREQRQGMLSLFSEARITFKPSYKLEKDRKYSKKRIPAYCDRILYMNSHHSITPINYMRVKEYIDSDHDMVIGMFLLEIEEQSCIMTKSVNTMFWKRINRFWGVNRAWIIIGISVWLISKLLYSV